jgi:glycine betaine/proline transport system substrate-binding protein
MKNTMKKLISLMLAVVLVFALSACSGDEEKIIMIGEGDWDSNSFQDQVVKIILEEGYGVSVDVITADTAVMIASLKTEKLDVCLEIWSDNVLTYNEDIANGEYLELSLNFDDNTQGLYVPRYLIEGDDALAPDLKTVKDLAMYADLFINPEDPDRSIIYGGPEGWGATEHLYKKVDAYGLSEMYDFKPIDSSSTLAATLSSAYIKNEPWVGYYWEPTWVLGLYDMVLLEDSEYSEEDFSNGVGSFATVDVTVAATQTFVDENPDLAEFFENYHTTSAIINEALGYMMENEVEPDVAAKWFLLERQDVWTEWVDDKVAEKVIEAIQDNE